MRIAEEYCSRLNPAFTNIKKLVGGYPSHEFVIDQGEATSLFKNVRIPTPDEITLENLLRFFQCVPNQDARNMILCLSKGKETTKKSVDNEQTQNTATGQTHTGGNGIQKPASRKASSSSKQKPARGINS
jgi:hypothetical protein